MDVFECIKSRRSIRSFEKRDVPNELLAQILNAGILSPSAGNTQPWEFIIVRDKKIKKQLSEFALNQKHVEEAPVLAVVLANEEKIGMRYGDRGKDLYCIQDTAACIENMLLACTALDLGACWVGAFEEDKVKDVLELPKHVRPVAILTIGFPVPYEVHFEKTRIPLEALIYSEKYGKKIEWMMGYSRDYRFGEFKPIDKQIIELKDKIESMKSEEKPKEEPKKEKTPEVRETKEKENLVQRFMKFVRNLPK